MATHSSSAPLAADASDDYAYEMRVHVPRPQIIEALTDDTVIRRWWTAVTRSERHGNEVQLFMGGDGPAVVITVDHAPGTSEVTWTVTDCPVMADWVGTKPSFSVQPGDDETCTVEFRHVGLRPALECFDQCRAGWNHFMPSLHQFLETGEGRPNEPRDTPA
ncbi:MAG: hypothetical protein QOE62_3231 [Actinomycetota bacterium]|nr:hypothetical protein [Actinomycetota bacterium]